MTRASKKAATEAVPTAPAMVPGNAAGDAATVKVAVTAQKIPAAVREMLRVTGPQRPYRRAGLAFGAEPVIINPALLREDQIAALVADPFLTVVAVDVDATDADANPSRGAA